MNMKKIAICTMLIAFAMSSFSQAVNSELPLTRDEYMNKSKGQKKTAWILLGTGTVVMGTGLILLGSSIDPFGETAAIGAFAFLTGGLMDVISIPFFISAGSNKRKSMEALTYIKLDAVPPELRNIAGYPVIPAAAVKVRF
jgi:uncharacterized membrane protein